MRRRENLYRRSPDYKLKMYKYQMKAHYNKLPDEELIWKFKLTLKRFEVLEELIKERGIEIE